MWLAAASQDLSRDLNVAAGGSVEVENRFGRVSVRALTATDSPTTASLTATSENGVAGSNIKVMGGGGRTVVTVSSKDRPKRIDLILTVPERTRIKIQTLEGSIEASGNFELVEAKTETGTIITDVPADDLKYHFQWSESRPRYLADFDIAEVKEKSAGRFEIRGSRQTKPKSEPTNLDDSEVAYGSDIDTKRDISVELRLATARGIILLNVPPNEMMSDLRERPLTDAAKAIIRSGDSLLMDAIRRASPKYFGDYARTLPPFKREPRFADRTATAEVPNGNIKTAVVRVTDLNNRSIRGLGPNDFEVVENGAAREVISVTGSTAPFNLVLLLDVSGSVENYVNFIRKAARNFVETVGSQDRISIVIFNDDVKQLSTFTTDTRTLSASLDTFDAGGGTAYYDALAYTISDTLRPLKGDRTAIVVLTDGDDNRSFLSFDSLAGSIQESGALIYPLYVPSGLIALAEQTGSANIDPARARYMSLTAKSSGEGERLAKISGGVYYPISQISEIQKAYEDIVIQMRSAYEVTYRSAGVPTGGNGVSPRLRVRSKKENTFAVVTSVTAVK